MKMRLETMVVEVKSVKFDKTDLEKFIDSIYVNSIKIPAELEEIKIQHMRLKYGIGNEKKDSEFRAGDSHLFVPKLIESGSERILVFADGKDEENESPGTQPGYSLGRIATLGISLSVELETATFFVNEEDKEFSKKVFKSFLEKYQN